MTTSQSYSSRPIPSPSANIRVRRTVAILVDVGYLCAQAAFALTGAPARGAVTLGSHGVDAVHALLRAADDEGLEVLRVYWYDGAINLIPGHGHRVVGEPPGGTRAPASAPRTGRPCSPPCTPDRAATATTGHRPRAGCSAPRLGLGNCSADVRFPGCPGWCRLGWWQQR